MWHISAQIVLWTWHTVKQAYHRGCYLRIGHRTANYIRFNRNLSLCERRSLIYLWKHSIWSTQPGGQKHCKINLYESTQTKMRMLGQWMVRENMLKVGMTLFFSILMHIEGNSISNDNNAEQDLIFIHQKQTVKDIYTNNLYLCELYLRCIINECILMHFWTTYNIMLV